MFDNLRRARRRAEDVGYAGDLELRDNTFRATMLKPEVEDCDVKVMGRYRGTRLVLVRRHDDLKAARNERALNHRGDKIVGFYDECGL